MRRKKTCVWRTFGDVSYDSSDALRERPYKRENKTHTNALEKGVCFFKAVGAIAFS